MSYVVKAGDTLGAIAVKFHTTVKALMAANPQITDPSKIQVGQHIKIPASKPSSPTKLQEQ